MTGFAGYSELRGAPEGGQHGETVIWHAEDLGIYAREDLMAEKQDTFMLSNGDTIVGFDNAAKWVLETYNELPKFRVTLSSVFEVRGADENDAIDRAFEMLDMGSMEKSAEELK